MTLFRCDTKPYTEEAKRLYRKVGRFFAKVFLLLNKKDFKVLTLKTADAIEKLKTLRAEGKKVGACFHIGC